MSCLDRLHVPASARPARRPLGRLGLDPRRRVRSSGQTEAPTGSRGSYPFPPAASGSGHHGSGLRPPDGAVHQSRRRPSGSPPTRCPGLQAPDSQTTVPEATGSWRGRDTEGGPAFATPRRRRIRQGQCEGASRWDWGWLRSPWSPDAGGFRGRGLARRDPAHRSLYRRIALRRLRPGPEHLRLAEPEGSRSRRLAE